MPRRKPGTVPRFAKSQTELGGYLAPPRDRKIIQQALKLEGNPGRSKDGRYEIAEWQAFINANFGSLIDPNVGSGSDKSKLEMEKLKLQNEKLQFELQVRRKDYTLNTEIEQSVGKMVVKARQQLQAIPARMAPQLIGLTREVDIETRLRREIDEALQALSTSPL
jgi:hypothetical protein